MYVLLLGLNNVSYFNLSSNYSRRISLKMALLLQCDGWTYMYTEMCTSVTVILSFKFMVECSIAVWVYPLVN